MNFIKMIVLVLAINLGNLYAMEQGNIVKPRSRKAERSFYRDGDAGYSINQTTVARDKICIVIAKLCGLKVKNGEPSTVITPHDELQ